MWYSKLYRVKTKNAGIYISVLPLLICYAVIIISQSIFGKNNLEVDTSGIYGAWPHYDLADTYRNAAQASNDPKTKTQLYALSAAEYRKVIQFFPTDPDCNFYLGTCYFCEGYPDSAIQVYKRALELNPKFSIVARNLGLIYTNKAQYDSAIHYFFMSYKMDSNMSALMDIGASYQQVGNYVMAMHYDSLLLKKDKNNKTVLLNMSNMYNAIKNIPHH
jgi:tetratricopeptide (TPR) repeat protein